MRKKQVRKMLTKKRVKNKIAKTGGIKCGLIWLILVLGLIVRLYKLNTPLADWHSWRQVDTASVAR